MKISELNHKSICILGYGIEGKSAFQALRKHAPEARITIADGSAAVAAEAGIPLITGPDYLEKLAGFDIIIKSPGIAWHPASTLAAKLTSATQIFLDSIPATTRTIGVTGTKGKSTTTNLIYQALKAGNKQVLLAGNIGVPMLDLLDEATPESTFVLELSSYQLETLHTSPHIAVVTSFFPDHLDYHQGLKPYLEAKKNIARFQTTNDTIFYNPDYPECRQIANLSPGTRIPFVATDFPGDDTSLKGIGNRSNLAAAYKVARHCGVSADTVLHALSHATGLPHRQESLGVIGGIEWIDDSAASTPQSTLAAIATFGPKLDTIIVGGLDRGYDFTSLGQALAASIISNVVLFPDTGAKIRAAIEAASPKTPKTYFETSDMTAAVAFCRTHTATGKAALLSSGSPSYNLFKNYPARGQAFRKAIGL